MSKTIERKILRVFREALRDVDPARAVQDFLSIHRIPKKVRVIAIGKSALSMAEGASRVLKSRIEEGLIILPRASRRRVLSPFKILPSDHPIPSRASLRAGLLMQRFVHTPSKVPLLFLISGGASSLTVVPAPPYTLAQKVRVVKELLKSGADIRKLNQQRKRMSAIKGGKIIRGIKVPVISLVVSDVIGDPLGIIASGLTVSSSARVHNHLLLPCSALASVVCRRLRDQGLRIYLFPGPLQGIARKAGHSYARRLFHLQPRYDAAVSYGETTVKVRGRGRGGRNLEFALGVAEALDGHSGITVASLATDGSDGTSGLAGAIVDGTTMKRAKELGLRPDHTCRHNSTRNFFMRLGTAVRTGPTESNYADLQIAFF